MLDLTVLESISNSISKRLPEQLQGWLLTHPWVIALGGVGMLLVLLLSFSLGSGTNNPFLPYYEAYQPTAVDAASLTPWEADLRTYYQQKEYELAIPLLEEVCEGPRSTFDYQFMLGSAYLEVGDVRAAVKQFDRTSQLPSIRMRRLGLWYYAIALVKSGDHEAAYQTLERLLNDPGEYAKDARELQSLLDV